MSHVNNIIFQIDTQGAFDVDGSTLKINISALLRPFSPNYLIYFPQLLKLDISGCRSLEGSTFIDCIQACRNLKEIHMVSCYHFSEYQVVRILTNLPRLEIVDCTRATPLMFCDAYTIVSSLVLLRQINVEPKHEIAEVKDWKRLVAIFRNVMFGHSVKRIFPHYGNDIRNVSETDLTEE